MIVTYIVTLYNKEQYIKQVIESLTKTIGDFKKHYIVINDGSTDGSLKIAQNTLSKIDNAILIDQTNQGPSKSTNTAIELAQGDYVQFVDGDDIVAPNSTQSLIGAVKKFNCEVAFSIRGTYVGDNVYNKFLNPVFSYIKEPIPDLLAGKISCIRRIGSSGSLVSLKLLKKIGGCDEKVFAQDFSLALRCARFSSFVRVNSTLSYSPVVYNNNNLSYNKNFEYAQSLLAIYYFLQENPQIVNNYTNDFYKTLWSILWKRDKSLLNLIGYTKSRLIKTRLTAHDLIKLYKNKLKNVSS